MHSVIERIQEDDPSYDPVALACRASRADRRTFSRALARVVFCGYYGPVSAWACPGSVDSLSFGDSDMISLVRRRRSLDLGWIFQHHIHRFSTSFPQFFPQLSVGG